jgi:hypothetical protein
MVCPAFELNKSSVAGPAYATDPQLDISAESVERARPPRGDNRSGAARSRRVDVCAHVARDALRVSDCRAAYATFADHAGLLHIALNASKGERTHNIPMNAISSVRDVSGAQRKILDITGPVSC